MSDEHMSEFMKSWMQEKIDRMKDGHQILEAAWPILDKMEISEIILEYYGSGDSGGFEELKLLKGGETRNHAIGWGDGPHPWEDLALGKIPVVHRSSVWMEGKRISETSIIMVDLIMALTDFGSSFLDMHHSGWENNDGGGGQVIFDVATRKVTLEHNEYYTESRFSTHTFGGEE